jgi:hypothetical protein
VTVNTGFDKLSWMPFAVHGDLRVRVVLHPNRIAEQLGRMRATIEGIAPGTRVETSDDWFKALLLSLRGRAVDLLLLDLAGYQALTPALVNHVRHLTELDAVRVFGSIAHPTPGLPCAVRAWSDLDDALVEWFSTHANKRGARHTG